MSWLEPIFDRTAQDIENVKTLIQTIQSSGWSSLSVEQKQQFLGELRGTLSRETLERIINNMYYLESRLFQHGYYPKIPTRLKNEWNLKEVPTLVQLTQLCEDLQQLVDCFYSVTREVPDDMSFVDFQKVNDMEKVEWDINDGLDKIDAHKLYCGQPYCGQTVVGGLLYAR